MMIFMVKLKSGFGKHVLLDLEIDPNRYLKLKDLFDFVGKDLEKEILNLVKTFINQKLDDFEEVVLI